MSGSRSHRGIRGAVTEAGPIKTACPEARDRRLSASLALALALIVPAGVARAQVTVEETTLGVGVYPEAGLVAVDEVTVVAQTVGPDGFRGSFDDGIAIVRDLGGAATVTHIAMGVMTPGLIKLDGGLVVAVTSGVDGQIGTMDDALLFVVGADTPTPSKVICPLGGTFVGGAALVQDVQTRDLIAPAGPHRVVATLAGTSVATPPTGSDVVLFVDAPSFPPTKTYVPAGDYLTRSPPTDLTEPGSSHEIFLARGVGGDQTPTTNDDNIVAIERTAPTSPWTIRSTDALGWGLVDGWQRVPRRFDADLAVCVFALPDAPTSLGFSPESELDLQNRVSVGFGRIRGLASPQDELSVSVSFIDEGGRWIPPSPFVRYVSAYLPLRVGVPHDLVEFTDLHLPITTRTWHVWPHHWGPDPVLSFYGQSTPVGTSDIGVITTMDPSAGGGWAIFDTSSSDTFSLNDGTLAQVGPNGVGWVENVTLGAQTGEAVYTQSDFLVNTAVKMSGGAVACLTTGFDEIVGNTDDGLMFCSGLPGAAPIGLGQPERPGGGPRLTLQGTIYPKAGATTALTFHRDSGITGAAGSWRWGFLVATPNRGFQELNWGRRFVSFTGLWEIIMIDAAAGVGASGWGTTMASLPGNPSLAGLDLTLQWIVHNPQSPWSYDTSNGLVIRLGQ